MVLWVVAVKLQIKELKGIEDSFKSFMAKYFDKGPSLARVYTSENCITIYCKDILTPMEKKFNRRYMWRIFDTSLKKENIAQ